MTRCARLVVLSLPRAASARLLHLQTFYTVGKQGGRRARERSFVTRR